VKVFFDTISSYSVQGNSATAAFTDTAIPANTYVDSIYAVVFEEKSNATTTGKDVSQVATFIYPVNRDVNNADKLLNGETITISDGTGSVAFTKTTSILTVDQLVAAMDGDTTIAGMTISADRDGNYEQEITINYYDDAGAAGTMTATAGKIYMTYGSNPFTGAAIAAQTADITGTDADAIATAVAAVINAESAFKATATNNVVKVTALVSNTTSVDVSPIPAAFNSLVMYPASASTTKLLDAGTGSAAQAASNTLAIASSTFSLTDSEATYSGVRITLKNTSTAIAKTMTASNTFPSTGNAIGDLATLVMPAVSITSSTLDYVAAFGDIESAVTVNSTAGTTDRTGWLAGS